MTKKFTAKIGFKTQHETFVFSKLAEYLPLTQVKVDQNEEVEI